MATITTIHPRYQETDKMGVIHHSVYPIWFEVGRTDFCNEIGFPFQEIEKRGIKLALTEIHVEYKAPTYYGDELTLITKVKSCSKIKLEFSYEIYNQNGKLTTIGYTEHVWLNDQFRPLNITKEHNDIYTLIISEVDLRKENNEIK